MALVTFRAFAASVARASACAVAVALVAGPVGAEPPASKVSIALLPLVVHSAEDPAYLRAGLADMLVSRLDQTGAFEIRRVADGEAATTDLGRALEAGRAAGARFVLFGSFTRFGQGASLDMQCASTEAGPAPEPLREIFVHSGSIGDVIPDLDELVGKVTRFAVEGFEDRRGDAVAAAADRARPSEAKLRQRVDGLERELRELRRELEDVAKKAGAQAGAKAR
ncbi:MAG: hypothetical protein R3E88_19195 [Myxococcota bacterium]|nr:hypothetical protein [Myxococcales bacterium]